MRVRAAGVDERSEGALLRLEREALFPLTRALRREWLEVDGLGGYASSTVVLCPTRRQHGLLVTRPEGLPRRHVFLSRFEEGLHRPEREFPLSTGRYPGTWNPTGHAGLHAFALTPYPSFIYRVGRTTVTREILVVRGRPVVLCRYALDSTREDIELRLRPLLAFREADALTYENLHLRPQVERRGGMVYVQPYAELPPLALEVVGAEASFEADPLWYRKVEYQRDLERGYYGHEDQFNPGWFSVPLRPGEDVVVAASLVEAVEDPARLWTEESARRRAAVRPTEPPVRGRLEVAAQAYPMTAPNGRPVLASGFPWPAASARDTLVAGPALLLGQDVDACQRVLEGLLPLLDDGLLPTRIGADAAGSDYEGVDPSLWLGWAVRELEKAGGDVQPFVEPLLAIVDRFLEGGPLGIRVDEDGLVEAGDAEHAVTWMDARVDGRPVTPRHGFAVEVNALWYHLLAFVERLCEAQGDGPTARRLRRLRRRARRAFLERFWIEGQARLADVWRDGAVDPAVRPNMVIAASLEWSPLTRGQRTDVVNCARAELLTPYGVRTLAPKNPEYRGHAGPTPDARDAAAHNGAAWPWLLSFYVEAWLRAYGYRPKRASVLEDIVDSLRTHLDEGGLVQLPEYFDGDPPHRPVGAFARAWSVAAPLRILRMLERGGV